MKFKNRNGYFDKEWKLFFVEKDTKLFKSLLHVFELYGIAVSFLNRKLILIDSSKIEELTEEHILAIEAHELGHFIAGHAEKEIEIFDEIEADVIAIKLLELNGLNESAQFLIDRMDEQGIFYQTHELSNKILADLKQYIKL